MPVAKKAENELDSVFTTGSLARNSGIALTTSVCLVNTFCIWLAGNNDLEAHSLNFLWFFILNAVAIVGHANLLSTDATTLFLARGLCLTGYALLAYLPLLPPLSRVPPIAASMGASGVFQTLRGLTIFFRAVDKDEFRSWGRWRFYYYYIGFGSVSLSLFLPLSVSLSLCLPLSLSFSLSLSLSLSLSPFMSLSLLSPVPPVPLVPL